MKKAWWKVEGVVPIFSMFFLEAFVLGNWIPRIPDVKTLFALTSAQLGIFLFILASGTLLAFLAGGYVLSRYGLRRACLWSLPCWALAICLVPVLPDLWTLGLCLFCAGLAIGILEIAMNTAADRLEVVSGRRFMSKAHGFWSLGSLVGALIGGAMGAFEFSVAAHFAILFPLTALVGGYIALGIPREKIQANDEPTAKVGGIFKLPAAPLFLLCLMPIGIMVVEGAFIDWSALYVRDVLAGGAMASGLIYAAFSSVMAATRLGGDWLLDNFDPLLVARVSALSASFGMTLFALSPNVIVAFIGALFAGLGTAIFYPLTMSAAAKRPGNAEDNVAAMSLFAFTSFMLAPPLLGAIADAVGLRYALLCVVPLAILSFYMSSELKRE